MIEQSDGLQGSGVLRPSVKQKRQLLDCLNWAAARIGPDILSFESKTGLIIPRIGNCLPEDLIRLLKEPRSDKADLRQLRCFSYDWPAVRPSEAAAAASTAFKEWILTQAPHIEALYLPWNDPRLVAFGGRLQHLKHVEMDAEAFAQGVSHAARQSPCLETLYLHINWGQGEIYVLGCQHLRHLVLERQCGFMPPVLHEPRCRLGIRADISSYSKAGREDWAAFLKNLQNTKDFHISVKHYMPFWGSQAPWRPGVRGHLKVVETLTLDWPMHYTQFSPTVSIAAEDAEDLVKCCMPVDGQPFRSLKVLIIRAEGGMWCRIPGGLPNLQELVLHAKGYAKLCFEDPDSTFSALKTFYVLSERHLYTEDTSGMFKDMDESSLPTVKSLAGRGLTTSFVSSNGEDRGCASCMYLRPIMALELTYEELLDKVIRLARQCRCRACFDCLRRAGCLTSWC